MNKHRLVNQLIALILVIGGMTAKTGVAAPSLGEPPKFPLLVATNRAGVDSGELQPQAYLPLFLSSLKPSSWIDTQDREAVKQFYFTQYLASESIDSGWTGNHANCSPGTTSVAFQDAVVLRINYYRAMSGVPAIAGFKASYNQKAQAAALMMSVNRQLNHYPSQSWTCYSSDGYDGASSSNLSLGAYGPSAIRGQFYDFGTGNYFVGHRRWILYPQTRWMGSGDIPPRDGYPAANALWVFDTDNMWGERPETRDSYVAWPPPGYVPFQVVYPRWSFAYAHADFSSAAVTVTRDGQPVSVTVNPIANGYGENTLVWESGESIPNDGVYTVHLQNVIINSIAQDFTYQVMVFDPYE
jgi:hypothetical protein